jgi:putative intracellular protease/amidase
MRIACLLAEDFEDSEYRKPFDALTDGGQGKRMNRRSP